MHQWQANCLSLDMADGRFTVRKHAGARLRCDLELEWNHQPRVWVIPKCPSLDPRIRRLAIEGGAQPTEYSMVWDTGTWKPLHPDVGKSLEAGQLKFRLRGGKLAGAWILIRTKPGSWVLIKQPDRYASGGESDS